MGRNAEKAVERRKSAYDRGAPQPQDERRNAIDLIRENTKHRLCKHCTKPRWAHDNIRLGHQFSPMKVVAQYQLMLTQAAASSGSTDATVQVLMRPVKSSSFTARSRTGRSAGIRSEEWRVKNEHRCPDPGTCEYREGPVCAMLYYRKPLMK